MIIYPAIDLLDGNCVRLVKGDFEQKTIYSNDPLTMAKTFESAGAKALHLVDLSGAKDPSKRQLDIISKLVTQSSMKIQSGGGVRTRQDVASLIESGVDRVVIGSVAVSDPALVSAILKEFGPAKITLALDVVLTDGAFLIAVNGWKTVTQTKVTDLITYYQTQLPLARVLCTDISKDGMMEGPNVNLYKTLMKEFPTIDFQASGGISSMNDLKALESAGVKSAVVGKAIYEGAISLTEVFKRGSNAH
jgi:phosphoribosylformimino-5-aminoimidazole carboxamide ribotide isomerase